jgi:protein-serine/threonine kinase
MNNQQQQQQGNRLNLNFGFGNQDRNQYQDSGRPFPTTPSTFPQPVYPNQAGQQEVWGAQQGNGYGNNGYFVNPYQQAQYQGQQGNLQAPQSARGFNDAANGLAQQFQHQAHLGGGGGGGGRSGSPYGRQPSPNQQRPRTAGDRGYHHSQYSGGHASRQPSLYDEEPPQKSPEKYSDSILKTSKMSVNLVSTFFKDSVQRARDRNQRCATSR